MSDIIKAVSNENSVRKLGNELGYDVFKDVVAKFNTVLAELEAAKAKEAQRKAELDKAIELALANIPAELHDDVRKHLAGTVDTKAPAEAKEKGTRTVQPPVEVVVDGKEYTVKMAGKIPTELVAVMKAKGFETKDRIKFAEQFKK